MDNRFGFKDLIVCVLLIAMIISFWLGRVQYDRQWDQLRAMNQVLVEQKDQLQQIRQLLANGVQAKVQQTGSESVDENDPFTRLREVRAKPDFSQGDWFVYPFG